MPFEDEFSHANGPAKKTLIIALVLILAVVGVAYAAYKITSPPSQPVTVGTAATLSAPIVNGTNLVLGDTLQLTTTLSDKTPNVQIFFYSNASIASLGSAYTDSNGQAIFNTKQNTVGVFNFTADCIHP
jgi:hypothetical protein